MLGRWKSEHLDVDKLLADWRWLCPQKLALIDRSAFGDLFLKDEDGQIFWLNVTDGVFSVIAESEAQFSELAENSELGKEWFAESDAEAAAAKGLIPGLGQCIGFATPLVFAESESGNTAYIIDIYEGVSFLGDLHKQLAGRPDGSKVRLVIGKRT